MRANSALKHIPDSLLAIFPQENILTHTEKPAETPRSIVLDAPEKYNPCIVQAVTEQRWKLSILGPALIHPKNSKARGLALEAIAQAEHATIRGNPKRFSIRTLRAWIAEIDAGNIKGLSRNAREDKGKHRQFISRQWDQTCPLPDVKKAEIAAALEQYVCSLWAGGAPSAKRIEQLSTSKLLELCQAAGWKKADMRDCAIGRHFIERYRDYSLVAIKERNAKLFMDEYTPRIQRNREGLKPGDVVIGDVHPLDVIKAHDGREVHARLIAWLDLATYDIFVTPVLLDKGRGIRQEDIARSFVDMVDAWGLPSCLYLDNGSEYKWEEMIEGFTALSGITHAFNAFIKAAGDIGEMIDQEAATPAQESRALIRARPYNAPAKQIEGVFGILERGYFSLMPGWIGGDRMKKRTHKIGEAPRAHQGDVAEFERDLNTCLELYRNTPQVDGSSPYDKRRRFIADGWRPIKPKREVFYFAFSEVKTLKVHAGGIRVGDTWGIVDALVPKIGTSVDIRIAKWDRSLTFYIDDSGTMHAIPMGNTFNHGDPDGAKEQSRRAAVLNEHIRTMKADTTRVDLLKEARRHLEALPPAPAMPEGITIDFNGQGEAVSAALAEATEPPPKLLPGQQRHPNTGEIFSPRPQEKGSNDAGTSFDPIQTLLVRPDKKEKPNPEPPAFDLMKHLSANPRKAQP